MVQGAMQIFSPNFKTRFHWLADMFGKKCMCVLVLETFKSDFDNFWTLGAIYWAKFYSDNLIDVWFVYCKVKKLDGI